MAQNNITLHVFKVLMCLHINDLRLFLICAHEVSLPGLSLEKLVLFYQLLCLNLVLKLD